MYSFFTVTICIVVILRLAFIMFGNEENKRQKFFNWLIGLFLISIAWIAYRKVWGVGTGFEVGGSSPTQFQGNNNDNDDGNTINITPEDD